MMIVGLFAVALRARVRVCCPKHSSHATDTAAFCVVFSFFWFFDSSHTSEQPRKAAALQSAACRSRRQHTRLPLRKSVGGTTATSPRTWTGVCARTLLKPRRCAGTRSSLPSPKACASGSQASLDRAFRIAFCMCRSVRTPSNILAVAWCGDVFFCFFFCLCSPRCCFRRGADMDTRCALHVHCSLSSMTSLFALAMEADSTEAWNAK